MISIFKINENLDIESINSFDTYEESIELLNEYNEDDYVLCIKDDGINCDYSFNIAYTIRSFLELDIEGPSEFDYEKYDDLFDDDYVELIIIGKNYKYNTFVSNVDFIRLDFSRDQISDRIPYLDTYLKIYLKRTDEDNIKLIYEGETDSCDNIDIIINEIIDFIIE